MKITLDWLRKKEACAAAQEEFINTFSGTEGAEYQEVFNALAKINRDDWASWLLCKGGSMATVMEVNELVVDGNLFFAGRLIVKGSIKVGKSLVVGKGIEAGWNIEAGGDIEAGGSIGAGWDIDADGDIKAGLNIEAGCSIGAGKGIKAGWNIEANDNIGADRDIEAGWNIKAGTYIKSGANIKPGYDAGIYAGLNVPISQKAILATVTAKERPKNLLLGEYVSCAFDGDGEV